MCHLLAYAARTAHPQLSSCMRGCQLAYVCKLSWSATRWAQVWKDALAEKAQSPYMTHRLVGGTLRDFHFCPYEVREQLCSEEWWWWSTVGWGKAKCGASVAEGAKSSVHLAQRTFWCFSTSRKARAATALLCFASPVPGQPPQNTQSASCLLNPPAPHWQDVLMVGHSGGVSSMLVPGSGEPHYDSMVADPYAGRKARREAEVHQLLDKLQPEMIVLDPTTIGQVRGQGLVCGGGGIGAMWW